MKTVHWLVLAAVALPMTANAQTQVTDTRIGKLSFENGYPSDETARKLFDEMDYQRAVQAYLWAYPVVSFESFDSGPSATSALISTTWSSPTTTPTQRASGSQRTAFDRVGPRSNLPGRLEFG